MRFAAVIIGIVSCFSLSACKPEAESHLDCAALISAATYLVRDAKVENDPAFMKGALVSMMTHLNTYAIPKGLRETEAFKELHALRASLTETLPPNEIMSRAKRCSERI